MILDRKKKKEYYDLGKEDDESDESNKNLELTLLEKICANNILSIYPNKKAKNIVDILIKDKKNKKILNNRDNHNIVIDFSSDKDSKNFIMSFKYLISLYKAHLKNK